MMKIQIRMMQVCAATVVWFAADGEPASPAFAASQTIGGEAHQAVQEVPSSAVSANRLREMPEVYRIRPFYPDGQRQPSTRSTTSPEKLVYRNTLGQAVYSPGDGIRIADDLITEAVADCILTTLRVRVNGGVPEGAGEFSAEVSLWDGCPYGTGILIDGTEFTFSGLPDDEDVFPELVMDFTDRGICTDGSSCLISQQDCADLSVCAEDPLVVPPEVWVRLRFDTNDAGVVVGTPATRGFSADSFDHPYAPCIAWFGGWPQYPHASFWVEAYAGEDCPTQHLAYLATDPTKPGWLPPGDEHPRLADDISLIEPNCELASYELGIIGTGGPYTMDIDLRLMLTSNPEEPEHPDNPNSMSARTRHTFSGRGTGSLEVARFYFLDESITFNENDYPIWITWQTDHSATGVPNVEVAQAGYSTPMFAVQGYGGEPEWELWAMPDGTPAVFYAAIHCKGPAPEGACCPPQPAVPGAETICYENVTALDCVGSRWLYGGTCDDFYPPCGTHACCKPDESCADLTYDECVAICEPDPDPIACETDEDCPGPRTCGFEGNPNICTPKCARWSSGEFCDEGQQHCPVFACYDAVGECLEPDWEIACEDDSDCPPGRYCMPAGICSLRVGCDQLSCCDAVCRYDPYCCAVGWDEPCAALAEDMEECAIPPANDECYSPNAGEGAVEIELEDYPSGVSCAPASTKCVGAAVAVNAHATSHSGDPTFCCSNYGIDAYGAGTIWYKFTAFHSSALISACDSGGWPGENSMILVLQPDDPTNDESACASLNTVIGCNDDSPGCGPDGRHARVCVTGLTPGYTYYVLMAARNQYELGDHLINLESPCSPADMPPANSECSSASPVVAPGVAFDLEGATMDCPSEPELLAMTNDLWYEYLPTCTGNLTVETCGPTPEDNPDTTLAVYEWGFMAECPPDEGDLLGSNDDADAVDCAPASSVTVPVFPGALYKIRLGGKFGSEPEGFLSLECVPDDCQPNGFPDIWEIQTGRAPDCNENLDPDECDIVSGYSEDCDDNDVPDECQIDRDAEVDCAGVPDPCCEGPFFCDFACDPDVNHNGIPDACDLPPSDEDGDGVPDADDNCPSDFNPLQTDADADGIGDACDDCPTDPDKTEPGFCGCGVPDYPPDDDGDGNPDCCPHDPHKVLPGLCGCGVPDDDTDGDGFPDCVDQCPGVDDKVFAPGCAGAIPTVSDWGLVALGLLLLAAGKVYFRGRRESLGRRT